jgi:hypothetical protein
MTKISENSIIWRYMDLPRYISLLSQGLFLCRPDMLGDNWEGSWGLGDVNEFRRRNQKLSNDEITREWERVYETKKQLLQGVGISSWHKNENESAALWKQYVPLGLGVAIQSSVEQVIDAIQDKSRTIECRSIKYIDYEIGNLGNDPIELLSHKRLEFKQENEIRFFLKFSEEEKVGVEFMTDMNRERYSRHVKSGELWPLIRPLKFPFPSAYIEEMGMVAGGINIKVDATKLIQKIYLSPHTPLILRHAVHEVTKLYGLNEKIISDTELSSVPLDVIKFHHMVTEREWRDSNERT